MTEDNALDTRWWREAKFGMFIHWSLQTVPGAAEAYTTPDGLKDLASRFDPRKFDANAWVRLMKSAGMRYVVLIGKHCDGFAMFKSPSNPFNIVDATPFGRDVMKELSAACRKAGIHFGVYYNQDWDGEHPGGAGYDRLTEYSASEEAFEEFQRHKVMPQLRELLTQYGPIEALWFDHSKNLLERQAARLQRLVRSLQPDCLICGRLHKGFGDYYSTGDHQFPLAPIDGPWEVCDTSTNDWFFEKNAKSWKTPRVVIHNLASVAAAGGNYLLNVAPDHLGVMPPQAFRLLAEVGRWLKVNGDAFYGVDASPFPSSFPWGTASAKGRTLYLLVEKWPRNGRLSLAGLRSRVCRAYLLADRRRGLDVTQRTDRATGARILDIAGPRRAPDRYVSVVALEMAGKIKVDAALVQQPDGTVILPAVAAEAIPANYWGVMRVGQGRSVSDWYSNDNLLSWRFTMLAPGDYDVFLETKSPSLFGWKGGHKVEVNHKGQSIVRTLRAEPVKDSLDEHYPSYVNRVGAISIAEPGIQSLRLRTLKVNGGARGGLVVSALRLVPRAAGRALRTQAAPAKRKAETRSDAMAWADKRSSSRSPKE